MASRQRRALGNFFSQSHETLNQKPGREFEYQTPLSRDSVVYTLVARRCTVSCLQARSTWRISGIFASR